MADASPTAASSRKPEWAPRMWEGAEHLFWLRLLFRNRFAVAPGYWYIAAIVTFVSFCNSLMRLLQGSIYGRIIHKTELVGPPIFILGHWRTGTTLLHEYLIRDERFGYPTTFECLEPNHFLLTEGFFTRYLKFLMPSRRPMDNMQAGFERPQEDEFALCLLGAGSPYEMIAFPNHTPQGQEFLDLVHVPPGRLRRWKRTFKHFLKAVTYKVRKRLVLKSPPHTARVHVLKQMFPDAVFIHIVRDPYVVFPSTVNLWRSLFRTHGLQKPTDAALEEYVLNTFTRMYHRFEEDKALLAPRQFYELRYEDLVHDPAGELKKLYDHLGLGGYEQFLPRLQAYLASIKGYETNRYQLTPEQRAEITRRWGDYLRRYGYDQPAT